MSVWLQKAKGCKIKFYNLVHYGNFVKTLIILIMHNENFVNILHNGLSFIIISQ